MINSGRVGQMLRGEDTKEKPIKPDGTLLIDYEKPIVHRLWWQIDENLRLSLHEIFPCSPGEAFFHPHRRESAMVVLSGRYVMRTGFGPFHGAKPPRIATTSMYSAGSAYEMVNPKAGHDVMPVGGPSLSLMLSGPPRRVRMPKTPQTPLGPLPDDVARDLLVRGRQALALVDHLFRPF